MSFRVNPHRMLERLSETYRRRWKDVTGPITERERELENALKVIIDDYVAGNLVILEEEENLLEENFEDRVITTGDLGDGDCDSPIMEQDSETPSSSASIYKPSPEEPPDTREYPSWEKVIEAVSFWRSTKPHPIKKQKTQLELETVQNSFGFVRDRRQLYRWEEMINRGDAPRDYKLAQLANAVRKEFRDSRLNQLPVHDQDLVRWSLSHAKKLNISDFTCSKYWLWNFKKTSRISSRKVTKFVSRKMLERSQDVVSKAEEFVLEMQELIEKYGADNVFNMDQSGFERSMVPRTTLADTGSAAVKVVTPSTSGLTHTYTVQPTISASGKLVTPVPVCLQEPSGDFGPIVKSTMFKCPDLIYPIASKSGKMGKKQLEDWFINVMLPKGGDRFVLIVDSYSAHKSLNDLIPEDSDIIIKPIPPGATGLIQPLDVHGFRFWKDLALHFNKEAMICEEEILMYARNPILKMQALIVRLLSNEKLEVFWKFAWCKCGYLLDDITDDPSPMQICVGEVNDMCSQCTRLKCIQCPHCETSFCFNHCFVNLHTNCSSHD